VPADAVLVDAQARKQEAIRAPGHSEARAVGALMAAGAGLVALSLALPHPSGGDTGALIAIAAGMLVVGGLCFGLARLLPLWIVHLVLAAAAVATGCLIDASGVAVGQYGSVWVWATLVAAYFFPPRVAAAHLAWLLAVYAVTLSQVESTAGYSALTRWLFTAISLSVVMVLTSAIVAHRARADRRARRFFDLSNDMLSTMDTAGRCIEVNGAWERVLGYTDEDLRGRPLLDLTHPEDRERATAEAVALFKGTPSRGLEARVQAKDGSWHWLRTSATLAADEGLVYARSTDVTELKAVEGEREELLAEVQGLAHSDALTGLPNRRALDAQLPREMARSLRHELPLCLAILDIDHFKAFNDRHGHLAGDAALRRCAIAWDSELRGEDTIVRFGGEEFLVVLANCTPEQAVEAIERLRAATPGEHSCSAGLALWDGRELAEDLIGRADSALYRAKASGRDRLVEAPSIES